MANISTKLHFPARLYQLIEIEDPAIIAWEIDGKSFRIVDSKRFRSETVPKYFRHGNMASIQRQLNLYGFRCTNRIDEKGVFCHPNFSRGQYDEVRNIRRKKTWPTKRKPKAEANNQVATVPQSSRGASSSSRASANVATTAAVKQETKFCDDDDACDGSDCGDMFSVLPDCSTPLSQLFESDEYANLLDFFDDKSLDDMMINTAALDNGDFDQNLLNLFANDVFPTEIILQ